MARMLVDDRMVAQNTWTRCCARCAKVIDPDVNAELGHCPHCGTRFSQMRLMTRQEARAFLRGRFAGAVQIMDRGHSQIVHRGIEDFNAQQMEQFRRTIHEMHEHQRMRIERRRQAQKRDECFRSPRVVRVMRRAERWFHELQEKIRFRRRVY